MKYELDSIDETTVTLDTYNSDLNLVIDASKYGAHALTKGGFAFMWAGSRATHGAAKGRVCFEVKIIEHLDVSHLPADEPNPHVVRVGFSVDSVSLQLGEDPLSYGYGGTGKISTNCQFKDFGPSFMAGDCILAVADLESDLVQIGFAKNGNFIGWAYKIRKSELEGKTLFPHVLSKNCSFEVNFGQKQEPYFKLPDPVKDYTFIGCLPMDQRVGGSRPPGKKEDCEMLMMCGLPGAGKSVWAADYSLKNPSKKYNILGTNNIIDKMKVMGLPRKRNYHGRWDVLIQMATKCLNSMFAIGSKLRRNYILDQTNVYPTAQRRKMKNFDGFKRIAVVVVPTEDEYIRRCDKRDREEGKEVPDYAVLEMKENFKLPEVSDIFEDVIFTELQRDEAEKLVKQYNDERKATRGPARKHFKPNEPQIGNKGFDNRKGNFNCNSSKDSMREGFRTFPDNQVIRGPNTYGGSNCNYGNFNNHRRFNDKQGGYDSNFGERGRGDYHNPGDYIDNYGGKREGYDGNYTGSYEDHSNSRRAGSEASRGGYTGTYRGSRAGYDTVIPLRGHRGGRSGYDGNKGRERGFDGGRRDDFDSNRGNSQGSFDIYGDYDGRDQYDSSRRAYIAYGTSGKESTGYVGDRYNNKSNHSEQSREMFRDNYNDSENIPGGSRRENYGFIESGRENYATEKFSGQGYRNNSSNVFKRGASNNRFQSGNRDAASRYEPQRSFDSDMYSNNTDYDTEGNYFRNYGSEYGEHKAQSSTDSYSTRNVQSSYSTGINAKNNPQRYIGSNLGAENKYPQGTGYSGSDTRTRWSAETSQTVSSDNAYSTGRPDFPKSAMSSQTKQTYSYQQGVTDQPASQPWMSGSAPSNPTSYRSSQASWVQYGQQIIDQYYSQ